MFTRFGMGALLHSEFGVRSIFKVLIVRYNSFLCGVFKGRPPSWGAKPSGRCGGVLEVVGVLITGMAAALCRVQQGLLRVWIEKV